MELTQDYLKSILHYNPDTGEFTRIKPSGNGKKAGSLNKHTQYIQIQIGEKKYPAHRLAFLYITGALPPDQVDHINGVRNDNRWINMRPVTNAINAKNMRRSAANTSGVTGVYWHINNQQWQALIKNGARTKYLGTYKDFFSAVCARKSAEVRYGFHENHGR